MNLLELKTLAEKATPGPWKCEIGQRAWRLFCHGKTAYGKHFEEYNGAWSLLDQVDSINGTKEFQQNNAQFIATANPQTILKLIEAVELMTKVSKEVLWIDQCRCDPAWTERNRHESNTYCGELDPLRDALARIEEILGE